MSLKVKKLHKRHLRQNINKICIKKVCYLLIYVYFSIIKQQFFYVYSIIEDSLNQNIK